MARVVAAEFLHQFFLADTHFGHLTFNAK